MSYDIDTGTITHECSGCGAVFSIGPKESFTVFCPVCTEKRETTSRKLSLRSYLNALKVQRQKIVDGKKLSGFDDTTVGDKDTQVTWGMCHEDPDLFPDPEDHRWPYEFKSRGRYAPKSMPHRCPFRRVPRFNKGEVDKTSPDGCFYECAFFRGQKPQKEQALAWYDEIILEVEARISKGES
jgi:hypothetical protein